MLETRQSNWPRICRHTIFLGKPSWCPKQIIEIASIAVQSGGCGRPIWLLAAPVWQKHGFPPGYRVGFWRMLDVLNKHKVRACCCLNLELLDHFPEVKDAMIAADWDYMAHGLYNSRPIYDYTEEQERAYWRDFTTHLKETTGKRLKGRLGGGAGYTVRTDDLMAEAGCLYHTSWIIDDQPWPINVRGGQKFIYVPYTGQTNDAGMLAWNRESDYFQQMIKDQF